MFQENKQHLQPYLTSKFKYLPEKLRKWLENLWAGAFYKGFYYRLKKDTFSVLTADIPSCPNIPVNVLVGLDYLNVDFRWTNEELYYAFFYNIQVRDALGSSS